MLKQIIFTIVLVLIGCGSFIFGFMVCMPVKNPQAEDIQQTQAVLEIQTTQTIQTAQATQGDQTAREDTQEIVVKPRVSITSIFFPDLESQRGLQKSLTGKKEQVLSVWETLRTANGIVNILLSVQAAGGESLSPVNNIMNKLSNKLSFAFSLILFWKILVTLSSYLVFLFVIPVCALITIIVIWTYKDRKRVHRIVIVSVLISLIVPFAIPASFKLSTLMDNHILSKNINGLVASIDEKRELADTMERSVLTARRQGASIVNFIGNARTLNNALIEDITNYFVVFIFVYLVTPILFLLVLFFITRYVVKLILGR